MSETTNPTSQNKHTNRLINETSPYLLQHAHNPVDWYPWSEEALQKAQQEDKPILLSVGYSACHWCHVMERESFENDDIAGLMNQHFVSIKVDREERPDIDNIYMQAVQALTQQGGWPMTVFLTPDGRPFYGGTYFPPNDRQYGKETMPGFPRILLTMADYYHNHHEEIEEQANQLADYLKQRSGTPLRSKGGIIPSGTMPLEMLNTASRELASEFDAVHGGFGHAPKFPNTMSLEFLLRTHLHRLRGEIGSKATQPELEIVEVSLQHMANGGIYDQLGGGFHRYSVDAEWVVPHFEKMVYDNALLSPPYLHAWLLTGEERYRAVAERTLEYMLRELRLPSGGFASSQDADTDGVEGLTYTWTAEEGAPAELLQPFEHGRSILRGELDEELRARLLAVREERPQPALDDKVIASWNGLALAALAEGARRLDRDDMLGAAVELGELLAVEPLWRTMRDGRARFPAYLDDHANVAHGLYELHLATGDLRWLREARRLALAAAELFGDPERGGFFLTPADGEKLVARQKSFDDNPTPSGSSMLAFVLLRLARIWGDDGLEREAVGALRLVRDLLARAPTAFGWALCALDLHLSPPRELAILGGRESEVARAALRGFDPNV